VIYVERDGTVALIVTTYSRTEKYIPLVRALLDTFWREHPFLTFLTDGDTQPAADVMSIPGLTWVELLSAGLARIKQERPRTTHVFHMLEDHCPLRCCDGERLDRIFAIARRHDFDSVTFPTYHWPWHETESTIYPDGLVRTWRRIETIRLEGEVLAAVPFDFFRYFQVQPTLWRLDYFEAACRHAKAQGIAGAWSFEAMRWPNAGRHYVSAYDWPSVHHGFLAQGKLNPAAIVYLDRKRASQVHRSFVREAIGVESPLLFDTIQMCRCAKDLIHDSLIDVKKWFATKPRSGADAQS